VFTIGSAEEVARNSKDLADIAKLRVSRACSQKPARFSVIRGDAVGPVRVRLEVLRDRLGPLGAGPR